jgi:anti-sigma regulatory factor (Ser/Thr protein kinase)
VASARPAEQGVGVPASGDRHQEGRAPLQLSLQRNVQAPGIARAAIAELCEEHSLERPLRQTLVLLASEVVSNAVLHSSGPHDAPIVLSAAVAEEAVRITVTDAGEGFTPTERDPERVEGGYGLYLVEKAASRWGVDATPPTSVWFELDRAQQQPG